MWMLPYFRHCLCVPSVQFTCSGLPGKWTLTGLWLAWAHRLNHRLLCLSNLWHVYLTLSFPLQMRTTALTGTQTWQGPLSPASPRRQHPMAGAGRAPSTSAPASQVQRLAEEEAGNQSLSLDLSVRVPRPCSAIPPLCSQLPIFSLVVLVYLHLAQCLLNTSSLVPHDCPLYFPFYNFIFIYFYYR